MFGYIRFILASLVLLSHLNITFFGLNPGVVAVVVFYMLAGFVVTHLLTKVFPDGLRALPLFYLERSLRIFPLYLFILILTLIFILLTGFGNPTFSLGAIVNHIVIVPLNYYMTIDSRIVDGFTGFLIPPAWSLGAELQAYLILPFVVASLRTKTVLALLTLGIFILANLSLINTDYFGYRLIPGIFFIFIAGSCVYKVTKTPIGADFFDKLFPALIFTLSIFAFIIFGLTGRLDKNYIPEVLLGIMLAVPIVYIGATVRIKLPYNALLGSLSYGVFLSHFVGIWVFKYLFPHKDIEHITTAVFVFLLSVLIAFTGNYMVERRVMGIRKRISHV